MQTPAQRSPVDYRPIRGLKFKKMLVSVGGVLENTFVHRVNAALNYLEVGQWAASEGYLHQDRFSGRGAVFDSILARAKGRKILYLEFGVAEGSSIKYWAEKLSNEDALLFGFDTFEGLPEAWGPIAKGTFSTKGRLPAVDSPRVQFIKGLFQDTLPQFELPPHDLLIINVDCDLYSGAWSVLNSLATHIVPGTFIYFDEFNDRSNELKAFKDFVSFSGKRFRLVATTTVFREVAFECIS